MAKAAILTTGTPTTCKIITNVSIVVFELLVVVIVVVIAVGRSRTFLATKIRAIERIPFRTGWCIQHLLKSFRNFRIIFGNSHPQPITLSNFLR
jgi:hypothetical protein